jgi:hypothetical protein
MLLVITFGLLFHFKYSNNLSAKKEKQVTASGWKIALGLLLSMIIGSTFWWVWLRILEKL